MKKIAILTVMMVSVWAVFGLAANRVHIQTQPFMTGEEPLEGAVIPYTPGMTTDSPGIVVGSTEYDYQTNGSSGNRVVLDTDGGVHFLWMKGSGGSFPPAQRAAYFNYVDNAGNWLVPGEGQNISQVNGDGYVQLSATSDNRAAAAYHSSASNFVIYAEDNFPGMGIFSYFNPPDMLNLRCYWPYLTVDRSDHIHIVMQENVGSAGAPQAIGYTRSVDGGNTWSALVNIDTLMTISQIVVSSPVSDKVAVVYTRSRDNADQVHNNVYYIESMDGLNWPWRNGKVNVTQYGGSDTHWAYTDVAAIYDYNDNLNIIWNAFTSLDDQLYYPVVLFHYSTGSMAITEITACSEDWDESCDTGAWNLPIGKMSMGVHQATNTVYAVYTQFDLSDCSAAGYTNGDICMNYSVDGGASWSSTVNMTDSQTPGCQAGDCDSDHWSTVADRVDGYLHLFYVDDKDAGGIPQTEGSVTDSPLMYLAFPNPVTSIDDDGGLPTTFNLSQNYPNPFNAKTNITFDLENASNVELSVYDITGARVTTLVDGRLDAGQHSVNWDANTVASGVYYYSLKANGEESTRKMTLLK